MAGLRYRSSAFYFALWAVEWFPVARNRSAASCCAHACISNAQTSKTVMDIH